MTVSNSGSPTAASREIQLPTREQVRVRSSFWTLRGSGKSNQAKILVSLIDPCVAPLRTVPRSEEDLLIAARNRRVLVIDNVSRIDRRLSDALCRLATGAGLSKRKLYTDTSEVTIEVTRPVILTGIADIVTRPDLFDRSLVVHLPEILQDKRRTELEILSAFEADRPAILGGLCKALSTALKRIGEISPGNLPRMADFAKLVVAAEPALPLEPGEFLAAYTRNEEYAVAVSLENSPIAIFVRHLASEGKWSGTAAKLLELIDRDIDVIPSSSRRYLPRTPNWLSSRLKEQVPNLRRVGVDVNFTHGEERIITIQEV